MGLAAGSAALAPIDSAFRHGSVVDEVGAFSGCSLFSGSPCSDGGGDGGGDGGAAARFRLRFLWAAAGAAAGATVSGGGEGVGGAGGGSGTGAWAVDAAWAFWAERSLYSR